MFCQKPALVPRLTNFDHKLSCGTLLEVVEKQINSSLPEGWENPGFVHKHQIHTKHRIVISVILRKLFQKGSKKVDKNEEDYT